MVRRFVGVYAAVVVLGLVGRADDKADAELKAFQGTWTYESMEWNGKKIPADSIKTSSITFDGDKSALRAGEKVTSSGTIKFDPSKTPMTFDATVAEGEGKGQTLLGIYKRDGDTTTACLRLTGRDRPTEYKTAEESQLVLVVLKRTKK